MNSLRKPYHVDGSGYKKAKFLKQTKFYVMVFLLINSDFNRYEIEWEKKETVPVSDIFDNPPKLSIRF
jgi:hypothetical protein